MSKSQAITDIEANHSAYYVEEVAPRVYVEFKPRNGGLYLATVADKTHENNLGRLPHC